MMDFRVKMDVWIVGLLRTGWIAGTLPILIASLPFSHLRPFHQTLLVSAGRGKIIQTSSRFGKLNVPQKFFSHFYVLAVGWTSLLLLSTWAYARKMGSLLSESTSHSGLASYLTGGSHVFSIQKAHSPTAEHYYRIWRSVFLLLLMELQVFWRLYESLYVFKYSRTARMHMFGYLTGLYFYTGAPLSLCCNFAREVFEYVENWITEFIVNGKDRMPPLEFQWSEYLCPLLKLGWCQWVGAAIFFWGWLRQRRSHAILGSLRDGKEEANDYAVPHGDWFEIVSSPHYLAEIVIYAGILIASGGMDLTVWLLFGFVVANLLFAAAETHRWYKRKFDSYPGERYAIIPFVF
uniref:3-oxo-5-alpha-steroid 4-dehydrogenase C-terminal domain-containing protein n=2 Tax=Opuntia streptacantha TaxID=393608 RepID=A0A7C9A574_OPUST